MLRDPMGLQTWADLPREFEDRDNGQRLGLPDFGLAPCYQDSSESSLQASPGTSQYSYDASSGSSGTNSFDNDVSLSSYLMDGNVRAMLKKVTVNESALNQAIQSLGGGQKGLKELMGYIVSWVREHQNEGSETLSLSQNQENLLKPPPSLGYGAAVLEPLHRFDEATNDLHQFYHPCTKSRRLGEGVIDRSDSHRSIFVNVSGSVSEEFQYPKLKMSAGSYSSIDPVMLQQGMHQQSHPVDPSPRLLSFAPGNDDLSRTLAATTTRAARKNRIARQRQQGLPRNGSTPGVSWSVAPPTLDLRSAGMFLPGVPPAVVVPGRKANNADMLTFLLQKELRPSDVGNLGRIILPKKEAEMHLPILALREGVVLQMEDFDSGICWNIRYRFWPNNKSRMYLLENTGELVKQHHLQEGDLLILYRNQQGNYVLRGKKKLLSESTGGAQGIKQKNAHSLARGFPEASKIEEVLKERDFELEDRSCQKVVKERGFGLEFEDRKAMKAEPSVLVGDDDPFFKEDVMHNIGSSFGPGLLQPLERFPSLNLDFPLDEIMAGLPKGDSENESDLGSSILVPKAEPAG